MQPRRRLVSEDPEICSKVSFPRLLNHMDTQHALMPGSLLVFFFCGAHHAAAHGIASETGSRAFRVTDLSRRSACPMIYVT